VATLSNVNNPNAHVLRGGQSSRRDKDQVLEPVGKVLLIKCNVVWYICKQGGWSGNPTQSSSPKSLLPSTRLVTFSARAAGDWRRPIDLARGLF
jgi:hypothetical protein